MTLSLIVFGLVLTSLPALGQDGEITLTTTVALRGVPVRIVADGPTGVIESARLRSGATTVGGGFDGDGVFSFDAVTFATTGSADVQILSAGTTTSTTIRVLPGWISIVPPLLAIGFALLLKQVIPALFMGLWLGSTALAGFSIGGAVTGLLNTFNVYVLGAVTTPAQAQILLFSFMIGGMVGIVIKNGGMQGVVNIIVRWATTPKRGQLSAASLGIAIFFDDYANTLVVGNTMRQVTDRLRVSREKLAYLVDSTAAPVACVALVSTWIGYEVGLIGSSVATIDGLDESAYSIFLGSIPYSFYPLLTMYFVFLIAGSGRDFGPMLAAERRARATGKVLGDDAQVDAAAAGKIEEFSLKPGQPVRAVNALVPIGLLLVTVIGGLYATGTGDNLRDIIGSSDSYGALMWASLVGAVAAGVLSLAQRILSIREVMDAWYAGLKSMLYAMIILVLAWSLSSVSDGLHTADYLVSVLGDALNPGFVPAIVFVLAAATAFSTGSSWSTMGILMPLVLPLVWAVLGGTSAGVDPGQMHILYSTVSCVLAGAVLGDHCSPISDTTILSSMATGSDHIAHVRTQLPYAITVGAVAVLIGTLPAGFGMPWWIGMLAGAGVLYAAVRFLGTPVEDAA